jgi:hypothetical protein
MSARVPGTPRRLVLLLALLTLSSSPAWAQAGKLTGVVRDQETRQPLAGAQVFVEGLNIGQLTRDDGRYFIINVPAGTHTVTAQLLGYATLRKTGVLITVDGTRVMDFDMSTEAVALQEVVVDAQRVPLVEMTATGTRDVVTAQELDAMPATDVAGILSLYSGYMSVPDNSDVISIYDSERGISPVRIRGGRGGETLTAIDGIPVNNFLLGGAALSLSTLVTEQIDYSRGGFEAKYGNALSGIIHIKTIEPRTYYQSTIRYQTSGVAGALGSNYDDFRKFQQLEGVVSGPIPATRDKLRFVASARTEQGDGRVLGFDDDVWNPVTQSRNDRNNFANVFDIIPGYRSFGFSQTTDAFGKLAYYFSPTARLTGSIIDYQRQGQPYNHQWLQTGFDIYGQCVKMYPSFEDWCSRHHLQGVTPQKMEDLQNTRQQAAYTIQNSVKQNRRLYSLNWDHTLSRVNYNLSVGRFDQNRDTCAFLSGVCLGPQLSNIGTNVGFVLYGGSRNYPRHPIFGTQNLMGGDEANSTFASGHVGWQATDHHELAFGVFYQSHDIAFWEGRDVGLNQIQIEWNRYAGNPWDAAVYVQDRIEYDFITIRAGLRYDYGRASGLFFANPQNPTNGTSAFHVCENPEGFGLNPGDFTYTEAETGKVYTGITACALNRDLMQMAVEKAMEDDFTDARPRRQFTPRIGFAFPVTESSSIFFNYGRFSQNPILNNLYRSTGIGVMDAKGNPIEGTQNALNLVVNSTRTPLVGNPHLAAEGTSSYELGFTSELVDGLWGLNVTSFMKDQFGLTGIRSGGVDEFGRIVFDPGNTYGSTTQEYQVLLNLDYQTVRGLEMQLRRRLQNYWGVDLRYQFSQVRTNAAPPELELQKRLDEGDQVSRKEIKSEINQPHTFSTVLRFAAGRSAPAIPLGELLRDARMTVTARAASGLPFTPTTNYSGSCGPGACNRLERNSGRGPMTFNMDLLAEKSFRHSNMGYGVFVRTTNLLNRTNCVQVFSTTGRCDGGAFTQARLQIGNNNPTGTSTMFYDRPDYKAAPRSINAGFTVGF